MNVWVLIYTANYSEYLVGIFSSKEKAIDCLKARTSQIPEFESVGHLYWEPENDDGFYTLINIFTDYEYNNIRLYSE